MIFLPRGMQWSYNLFFRELKNGWDWKTLGEGILFSLSAQADTSIAGCPSKWLWSIFKEILQPHWATCLVTLNIFQFPWSKGTFLFQFVPLACHWTPQRRALLCFLCRIPEGIYTNWGDSQRLLQAELSQFSQHFNIRDIL